MLPHGIIAARRRAPKPDGRHAQARPPATPQRLVAREEFGARGKRRKLLLSRRVRFNRACIAAAGQRTLMTSGTYSREHATITVNHQVERVPALTTEDLRVPIPTARTRLLDEIACFCRSTDAQGNALAEEHRTPEEREKQRAAMRAALLRQERGRAELSRRPRVFVGFIVAAAGGTGAAPGIVPWRRARLRTRPG